ncbi:MAG: mechanosensitive ion channel [Gammaproteobacteria bacterium]|nr:mechanosensitive ion channel [Gammaproteobacteria bacterium]
MLLAFSVALPSQAASPKPVDPILQARKNLERLEKRVVKLSAGATTAVLKTLLADITAVRETAIDCVEQAEKRLDKLQRERAILSPEEAKAKEGDKAKSEEEPEAVSPEIARERKVLASKRAGLEERRVTCELMRLRAEDLDAQVDDLLQAILARQLLTRGPDLVEVIRQNLEAPEKWWLFAETLARKSAGSNVMGPAHLGGLAAVGLLGFVFGYVVPRRLRARSRKLEVEEEVSAGLLQAVAACGVSYAPVVLALGAISAYLALTLPKLADFPYFVHLTYGLLAYFVVAAGIRTLLNPCPPAGDYLPLPTSVTHPLSRRARLLVLVMLVYVLFGDLRAEGDMDVSMFLLVEHLLGLILVLNVIWIIWLLRGLDGWRDRWAVRLLLTLALAGSLVAAWAGYLNLARLVVLGIVGTLATLGLTLLLARLLSEFFDGLDEGHYGWQRSLRRGIGLKGDEHVPGLVWLRLVASLGVWLGFAFLVLRIWGLSGQAEADIIRYFTEGFELAGLKFVPSQLLWAIFLLSLFLTLTRWFKGRLERKWLRKTRMDRGAQEALVTTSGYVGVAIAILVALSVAGIQFTNLAIIAGALSVGIGFGLQNVVNNFVSGLILLVERPVKTGDWIIVGGTEGYVKRISIRSTLIQTRDLADVIVPNSELISGQVTNLMLRDLWGRIRVPIGVAYGSDTAKVKEILLEIANNNPEVIKGSPRVSDPQVLFMAFADSSLNFELRCFIRDVDRRFRVTSEINFAIDAAFREHGIQIPFPQRDLHIQGPLPVAPRSEKPDEASGNSEK